MLSVGYAACHWCHVMAHESFENAAATAAALRGQHGELDALFRQAADVAVQGLSRDYDAARGGFGAAPKFPPSMVLEFLLRHHERTGAAVLAPGGTTPPSPPET